METISTKAFGAYDLRGIYPGEINEEMAYRIGRCFKKLFAGKLRCGGKLIFFK